MVEVRPRADGDPGPDAGAGHLRAGELARLLSPAAVRLAPRRVGGSWDQVLVDVAEAAAQELFGAAPGVEPIGPPRSGRRRLRVPRELLARAHVDGDLGLVALAVRAAEAPRPRPVVWGVVNATPDSFSDGGRHADVEAAVEHGLALEAQGALVVDVGGESTRPGAAPVDADEECARVLPVVEGLVARLERARVSVDTMKSEVARRALELGATWINDPSGGAADPAVLDAVAAHGAGYACMHMRGTPRTMQVSPHYDDTLGEVCDELRARLVRCVEAGVAPDRLLADPGLGFGKRLEDNLALLARLDELRSLGVPLLVGASRKSFVGTLTGVERPDRRLAGSLAAACLAVERGAAAVRVHDVGATVEALALVDGTLRGGAGGPS